MMRFVFVFACGVFALYYFFPTPLLRESAFAKVNDVVTDLRAAVPWPGQAAEDALANERNRSASLEREAASLREQLLSMSAEQTDRDETLKTLSAAAQRERDETRAQRQRADALTAELLESKRISALQMQAAKAQLDDQRSQATELARIRAELGRVVSVQVAAEHALQVSQADARANAQKSADDHKRAETLAAETATQRQDAANQIASLQTKLQAEQMRSAALARAAAATDQRVASTVHDQGTSDLAGRIISVSATSGDILAERHASPENTGLHVVLHYTRNSESAKSHALKISQLLQDNGVSILGVDPATQPIQKNIITYHYRVDRKIASRVADLLPEFRSSVHRSTAGNFLPRPGLIDIEIAS